MKLQERNDDALEFFMHDDMHGVSYKHFHVEKMFLRNIYNDPILGRQCKANKYEFVAFLLNTSSVGLKPTQPHVFEDIVVGTNVLNLKAGLYSPHGGKRYPQKAQATDFIGETHPEEILIST